ncbi:MAG: hypothetical protein ACAH24_16680 [Hyphomicrobiaceae bacterium]|jgi:ribosomal protein L37AE/L43A
MVSISDFKDLYEIFKKAGNVEAQRRILDLEQRQIETERENQRLHSEIASLRQEAELKQKLKYEAPYYFVVAGEARDGPFCQHCYDTEHKLVHLQPRSRPGAWHCQACKNSVADRSYQPPPPRSFGSAFER